MKTYVLFHANCPDGLASAAVAWSVLREEAEYIPVHYSQPPPSFVPNSEVYILDFSFPREVLTELKDAGHILHLIDHHKMAQEALGDWPGAVFDLNHSGAVLTWKVFREAQPVPAFLQYIEDRDLWRWKLPHSREFSAGLGLVNFDFRLWAEMMLKGDAFVLECIEHGEIALRFKQQQVENLARRAKLERFAGYLVPVVNATLFFSEVGERLLEIFPEAPFAVSWFVNGEHMIQYSFRSRPDFDVSRIAKEHGGGGHPAAAGTQFEWADQHLEYVS